jgi:hypothetical protein
VGEELVDQELGIPLPAEEAVALGLGVGLEPDIGLMDIGGQQGVGASDMACPT